MDSDERPRGYNCRMHANLRSAAFASRRNTLEGLLVAPEITEHGGSAGAPKMLSGAPNIEPNASTNEKAAGYRTSDLRESSQVNAFPTGPNPSKAKIILFSVATYGGVTATTYSSVMVLSCQKAEAGGTKDALLSRVPFG